MEAKKSLYEITLQCSPEVEEEYNAWLDDTHIPMLLQFKGLKGVTKYKLVAETEPHLPHSLIINRGGYSEYMLILEFDNQQDCAAYETSPELAAASEEALTHDWHGLSRKTRRLQYELIGSWK